MSLARTRRSAREARVVEQRRVVPRPWAMIAFALPGVLLPQAACGRLHYDVPSDSHALDAAGRDARTSDAPPLDVAPAIDAPDLDAPEARAADASSDVGPDAADLDASSFCGTAGVEVGRVPGGHSIVAFGLAQSADGSRGLRSYVYDTGALASDLSGSSVGTGWFAIGMRGPTSVALLDDASLGGHVFDHVARGLMIDVFRRSGGSVGDATVGAGSCPTARCVAELDGRFVVLEGPVDLRLTEVRADASLGAMTVVATGTSEGMVRSAASGVLVGYVQLGSCVLSRFPTVAPSTATGGVVGCSGLDVAELADRRIAMAWVSPDGSVHVAIANEDISAIAELPLIDGAQATIEPVEVSATASGFRVTWLDDSAAPVLRSARFDEAGSRVEVDCVAAAAHSLADLRAFHAVRRGGTSAIEWPHEDQFFGVTLTD